MASTSDVINALKYTYGTDQVLYLLNQEVVCWNMFSKMSKPMGGRGQFILPIMTKNPGSWAGIAEGGALPANLDPGTTEATFSLKEFAGLYNMSWKLLQDARNSKLAFQTALKFMEEGFRRRVLRLINADLISDGLGKLGILSAADNQTTITVNALPSVDLGMVVDLIDASDNDADLAASRTVQAVDPINRKLFWTETSSGDTSQTWDTQTFYFPSNTNPTLQSYVSLPGNTTATRVRIYSPYNKDAFIYHPTFVGNATLFVDLHRSDGTVETKTHTTYTNANATTIYYLNTKYLSLDAPATLTGVTLRLQRDPEDFYSGIYSLNLRI